jgi:hypothetical protein
MLVHLVPATSPSLLLRPVSIKLPFCSYGSRVAFGSAPPALQWRLRLYASTPDARSTAARLVTALALRSSMFGCRPTFLSPAQCPPHDDPPCAAASASLARCQLHAPLLSTLRCTLLYLVRAMCPCVPLLLQPRQAALLRLRLEGSLLALLRLYFDGASASLARCQTCASSLPDARSAACRRFGALTSPRWAPAFLRDQSLSRCPPALTARE